MAGPGARSRPIRRGVVAALLIAGIMLLASVLSVDAAGGEADRSLGSGAAAALPSLSSAAGSPALSPGSIHSLSVTTSNVTTLQGDSVNFTVSAPAGVTPVSYLWDFGDGTSTSSTGATVNHTFAGAGQYLVYVQATAADGTVYDNLQALLPFSVQSSYTPDINGNLALLDGAIQENSTANRSAQADVAPGGSVLVANWIDVGPNSPFWQENLPFYDLSASALPYAILSTPVLTLSGIDAVAVSFSDATPFGAYELTFGETTTSNQGAGGSATANFTFTVFVAAGAEVAAAAVPTSPHPGTLNAYLTGSGLEFSADPGTSYAVTESTADYNVYQTLVAYNGSKAGPDSSDFVADLATCVPGPDCQAMYGTSLIGSGSGAGDWTFVINPNATFYNRTTGAHYPVTPNDVAFSFARACLLTDYPFFSAHGSWVLCQALLPTATANAGWDHGLHAPLNNTPANILAAITVNDSSYCTPEMMNGEDGAGCVTLHTSRSGQSWPELLEFVASPYGGSVISCRWASTEGYGLPGWESGSTCLGTPPASDSVSATAWDTPEMIQGASDVQGTDVNGSSPLAHYAVGSGPYALTVFGNGSQLQLTANPYWGGTTCSGGVRNGCLPAATADGTADYIGTVNVYLNGSSANQTKAVENGTADIAGVISAFPASFVAGEFREGKLQFVDVPTVFDTLAGMNMFVNLTAAQDWTATHLSFPSNLMTDLNFRQFLIHSFPTPTLQSGCIADGLESCFQSGGAIPTYMSPYYPSNVSWFFGAPDTNPADVGGAAWWWNQTASDGLDGVVCTPVSPCTFPLVYINLGPIFGAQSTASKAVFQTWATDIRAISQNAIDPVVVTANFSKWGSELGEGGSALYEAGWDPDYFDPSDYAPAFYLGNYAADDSVQNLTQNSSLDQSCAGPVVDPVITLSCQGSAYTEMESLVQQADNCVLPNCGTAQRALLYDMAEQIANGLGLFANTGQSTNVLTAAPWIDTTTLSHSPFEVALGLPFYYVAYRGSVPSGYPLVVSSVADPPDSGTKASGSIQPALSNPQTPGPVATLEAGETFVLSVSAAGGSGVYHFDWLGLPPGCASPNAPFVICSPNGSANTTVSVVVTDSNGDTALATGLAVVVVPRAEIHSVLLSPSSIVLGHTVTIDVNESGGLPPLTYLYLGLPPGCASTNATQLTCTPSVAGNYAIVVQAVDSVGVTALGSASLAVTSVTPPPPPSGPATISLSSAEILAIGSAIGGFLIGAGVVLIVNRRRQASSKNPPSAETPPDGPSG